MAKAPSLGHEQVLENLQKAGTLSRKTVVHIIQPSELNSQSVAPSITNHRSSLPCLEERTLILSDGTQIIIESVNEFMLVGPTGARIVLNSLPLFLIPDQPQRRYSLPVADSTKLGNKAGGAWMQLSSSAELDSKEQSETNESKLNTLESSGSMQTFLDPLPRLDDVFTNESTDDNIFTYLDPFNQGTKDSIVLEESVRDEAINNAFEAATGGGDISDSDDDLDEISSATPFSVKYVEELPRAASFSFVKISATTTDQTIVEKSSIPTNLPPPPVTLLPRYETKSGWLIKLSHQRGVFGDKWQKRYFILNRSKLSYFKKYGDSIPRGTIELLPGSWCHSVSQGSPRMTDAVAKSNKAGIISVNRCLGVHRPNNFSASLSALLASEGAVDAFSSLTVALNNPSDASRTFYMIAPSEQERHSWVDAISHNMQAYARSTEALDTACNELQSMLQAVSCNVAQDTLSSILLSLHLKRDLVAKTPMDFL